MVAPCSKLGFAGWWAKTAAPRFAKIPPAVLDHRRFWDAMHAVTVEDLAEISRRIALAIVASFRLDCSSVALDMTNFATFIDTGNGRAPIAQRGKAKQKRSDLRLVGLGLVVTRDGGIPLTWHAYPGNRPDVTQFPAMIKALRGQYEAITAACGQQPADMTVVFNAGQNSEDNFAFLAGAGLHYIGSVPASDCPDLTALPASARSVVDQERFGGLTGYDTPARRLRRRAAGDPHQLPELHESQARGFTGTPWPKAGKKLDELAATLARGKTRRPREKVEAEIEKITAKPWVRRVITWQLSGEQVQKPAPDLAARPQSARRPGRRDLRQARADHRSRRLARGRGHRRLPVPVRSRVRLPPAQRPRHVVSFSPMFHWTGRNIRVHVFTLVTALQIARLMRLKARRAGLDLSVRALLGELAGIGETILLYQNEPGRPRAHRMLTDTSPVQDKLSDIFGLARYAPRR